MEEKDIINFRKQVESFSLEELEQEAEKLRDAVSKMILDSDLIVKAAIVDTLIKEKKGE